MKFLYSPFSRKNDLRFKLHDMVRAYNIIAYLHNKDISFYHYKLSGEVIKSNPYGLHIGKINIDNGIVTKKSGWYLTEYGYINHTLLSEKEYVRNYKMRIFK